MLTSEQIIKARQALARQQGGDEMKYLAIEWHKKALYALKNYGLPYKVYYDYLKSRYEHPRETVEINPCYPMPGYPVDKTVQVKHDDFNLEYLKEKDAKQPASLEQVYIYENLYEDKKVLVDIVKHDLKQWEVYDNTWKEYFLMYLVGYDFGTFTEFDFIGKSGELGAGEVSLLRHIYKRLQREYEQKKDSLVLQEPKYEEQFSFLYQDKPFTIIWDLKTAKERAELEKYMKLPPNERERKMYLEQYGVDIYS